MTPSLAFYLLMLRNVSFVIRYNDIIKSKHVHLWLVSPSFPCYSLNFDELSAECCTLAPNAARQKAKLHTERRQHAADEHSSLLQKLCRLETWPLEPWHNECSRTTLIHAVASHSGRVYRGSWLCWQPLLKAFAERENKKKMFSKNTACPWECT